MNWLRKLFTIREQKDGDLVKPFLDHLEDLRATLFKLAVTLVAGMVVAWNFRHPLTRLVMGPILKVPGIKVISGELTQGFMLNLKLSFYAGIVLSFPILLYFVAEFVLPALTRKEKRLLFPGIVGGFILFALGVYAAYIFILPKTIEFFYNFTTASLPVEMLLDVGKYFGLVTNLCLACGLLCELPIVVLALSLLGIVSYPFLASTRPYAMTLMLVVVAMVAPTPDPFTFVIMAAPVLTIYEACIWIVWAIDRRRRRLEISGQNLPD